MGVLLALVAGAFMPLTNLTTRKGVDVGGSARGYFVFQTLFSLVFALLLGPVRHGEWSIPLPAAMFGVVAGCILSSMLYFLGRAVESGPPGLTFAILNSATIMPGLLMASLFGEALGFAYTGWHAFGSFLVLAGLFWGVQGVRTFSRARSWLVFSGFMFLLHILLLALYQWKAMLMRLAHPEEVTLLLSKVHMQSEWFTPFMFATACLFQLVLYFRAGGGIPRSGEVGYGMAGGLTNLLCTFFLLWAAEAAGPLENAVIYPIFSIVGILLTNFWGQWLYGESVNWKACQLCLLGLMVGTIDWKIVAAAIGF